MGSSDMPWSILMPFLIIADGDLRVEMFNLARFLLQIAPLNLSIKCFALCTYWI